MHRIDFMPFVISAIDISVYHSYNSLGFSLLQLCYLPVKLVLFTRYSRVMTGMRLKIRILSYLKQTSQRSELISLRLTSNDYSSEKNSNRGLTTACRNIASTVQL